jgi:hypothetical protein
MPDAAQIAVQRNALLAAMQKAAMYGSQRALFVRTREFTASRLGNLACGLLLRVFLPQPGSQKRFKLQQQQATRGALVVSHSNKSG